MVPITRELIQTWTRCKVVIRHGVGYDNVDVKALTEAGIPLCYIPDYCIEEVAEQAIALIFACARRVVSSRKVLDESAANGRWDFKDTVPVFRMAGQKLGILGCGRIGSRVYQKLKSFGFPVPHLRSVHEPGAQAGTGHRNRGFENPVSTGGLRHHPYAVECRDAPHRELRNPRLDETHGLRGEHRPRGAWWTPTP